MRLNQLDGKTLVQKTVSLVAEERRITLELIEHLREIERRMLFCDLGYGSLFDFCVRHLGLSEGSAQRRISAMRLIRDVPEAKAALHEGTLSLTNAAKLQSAFQSSKRLHQELKREEKLDVLEQVTGLTQKECEAKLFEALPGAMKEMTQERERLVGQDSIEITLVMNGKFHEKLLRLKALLSHRIPSGKTLDVLEHLIEKELDTLEKKRGLANADGSPSQSEIRRAESTPEHQREVLAVTATPVQNETSHSDTEQNSKTLSKTYAEKRRSVWRRAQGRCEIRDCGSRYQLEVDHILPRSVGGTDDLENLRLICRAHNAYAAKRKLGHRLMSRYLPRTRLDTGIPLLERCPKG